MGTEILVLFMPVMPIAFIYSCWVVVRKIKDILNRKFEIILFIATAGLIIHSIGNFKQGMAIYGFLTFIALLFAVPVVILTRTKERRIRESQVSNTSSENNV